jgi:hypothetical protein
MSAEETSQPSAVERAARQAANHAAQRVAKQALIKLGAVLGAKGAAVVAAVIALIALVVGFERYAELHPHPQRRWHGGLAVRPPGQLHDDGGLGHARR